MSASLVQVIAELTIAASVAILFVAAVRKPLRRFGGARVTYSAWVLVPASQMVVSLPAPSGWLEPAAPVIPQLVLDALPVAASALPAPMSADAVVAGASYALTNYAGMAVAVWVLGSVAMLLLMIRRHRAFIRSLGTLTTMKDGTRRSSTVRGPVLVGAWRPIVVVPVDFESLYDSEERALILAHERAHLDRGDALFNIVAALWLCLSWFNPLVYWAVARFRFDQELACDAVALAPRATLRRRYADALLRTQLAAEARAPVAAALLLPLGCPWESHHPLKERIAVLKRPLPTAIRRIAATGLTYAAMIFGSYAVWTALPGPALAQPEPDQITVIMGSNMRLAEATAGALATMTADFKSRLGDGNNDFEITMIQVTGPRTNDRPANNVTLQTASSTQAVLQADRVLRRDNGDVEMSNVILKLLPGGPADAIQLDTVRIMFQSGVLTTSATSEVTYKGGVLTADRATVEKDGTIRMVGALFTPAPPP